MGFENGVAVGVQQGVPAPVRGWMLGYPHLIFTERDSGWPVAEQACTPGTESVRRARGPEIRGQPPLAGRFSSLAALAAWPPVGDALYVGACNGGCSLLIQKRGRKENTYCTRTSTGL